MIIPTRQLRRIILIAILAADSGIRTQRAYGAEAVETPSLTDQEVVARIENIQTRLDRIEKPARNWRRWWLGIFGGLALAQGIGAAVAPDRGLRTDALVGGIGATVGTLSVLLVPKHSRTAAAELRFMPGATPEQRLSKLKRAEQLLRRSAEDDTFATAWFARAASESVPIASGLTLWLKYDRPVPGLINFTTGSLIGQTSISTHPTGSIREWRESSAEQR